MKIIVIGGKGHIGSYLCPMLAKLGHEVVCVTRGNSRPYVSDSAWSAIQDVTLDCHTCPDFAARIAAIDADGVVDLLSFTVEEVRQLVEALRPTRLTHYLFCSSLWEHGRAEILPWRPDDLRKAPLEDYGKNKFACELYLKDEWRRHRFPATIVMPGHISGPAWTIINPWGNTTPRVFQEIADDRKIYLPHFGMETLNHVHGKDVAQLFCCAVEQRNAALGEAFHAVTGEAITLYGYAKHAYEFFGHEPDIGFLPWKEWCEYVGDQEQTDCTYAHIARSGLASIEKETRLLGYRPQFSILETIDQALNGYLERGIVKHKKS